MSHQDQSQIKFRFQADDLRAALLWLLNSVTWNKIRFRAECTWSPLHLAAAALLWVWSPETSIVERFQSARKITEFLFPRQQQLATSYQAFTKMLRRWTSCFVELLQNTFRQQMQRQLPHLWTLYGYVVFGVDGSRIELPRTVANERHFSGNSRRRKRTAAQNKKKFLTQECEWTSKLVDFVVACRHGTSLGVAQRSVWQ